jgi:hypothetical protein
MQKQREPFAEFARLRRGIPLLETYRHRKTTTVSWYPEVICDQHPCPLDSDGMNAELLAVWQDYKPQCDKRAQFSRGQFGGCMSYVPHVAGIVAATIVREHFTRALRQIIKALDARDTRLGEEFFSKEVNASLQPIYLGTVLIGYLTPTEAGYQAYDSEMLSFHGRFSEEKVAIDRMVSTWCDEYGDPAMY